MSVNRMPSPAVQSQETPLKSFEIMIPEELKPLITGYLENRGKDLVVIRGALDLSDFATIARIGHTMKGSGSCYGLAHVTAIGTALEEAALKEDSVRISEQLDHLLEYMTQVSIAYNK